VCGPHGGVRLLVVAQVVSLSPVAVETWVRSQVSLSGICGGKAALGQDFLGVLWFVPVMISLPMLHTHVVFVYYQHHIYLSNW
jgi:hypothetical protein